MFDLFTKQLSTNYTHYINAKLHRDLFILGDTLERIMDYERNSNFFIDLHNNPLVKLLNNIDVEILADVDTVITNIHKHNFKLIAKYSDIASDIDKGSIIPSVIVPNCKELFIYTSLHNLTSITKDNYHTVDTIKCIYHNRNELSLFHPTRYKYTTESDLFIYAIDIPALVLQYKYWIDDRLAADSSISLNKFLYTVVYTNLMPSILDISMFNIYTAIALDKQLTPYYNPTPISVRDMYSHLITGFTAQVDDIKKRPAIQYDVMLSNIPLYSGSALEVLRVNIDPITRYNNYVLFLARIPIIEMLLSISTTRTLIKNPSLITDLEIDIKMAYRDRIFDHISDPIISSLFTQTLNTVKDLIEYKGR